ncbi:MAG: 50S ribosomal protein L29 [Patescibacteria group bacterium]
MKGKEIIKKMKNATPDELSKELKAQQDRLWNLKTDLASGKVKNVSEIKQVKHDIARILTILNTK